MPSRSSQRIDRTRISTFLGALVAFWLLFELVSLAANVGMTQLAPIYTLADSAALGQLVASPVGAASMVVFLLIVAGIVFFDSPELRRDRLFFDW